MAGGLIGVLASLGDVGNQIYRGYGRSPINASANQGSAIQGTFGREYQAIYAGRSPFENSFLGEKGIAAQMAGAQMANARRADVTGLFTGPLASAAKGAAVGGAAGAAFAGIGAIPGAIGGGAVGLFKGISDIAGDPRQRALAMSPFSKTFSKEYESMQASDFANNYQRALDAEKNKNPLKTMAAEDYQQNYPRNLDFQRSTGLDFNSFHGAGGFRERTINAGFTDQMGMGMAGNILGAGGSSAASRDLSTLALQAQRGMNVTNAGSVIGQISGTIGSSNASNQATVRLLQEGVALGFDSSKYAEENRKFLEIGAQAISKSGTSSAEGASAVIEGLSRFLGGDRTIQGISAGANAYQKYQEISTSSSGPRGVIRAAGILQSGMFGGLSAQDRMAISSIPDNELTPDDPRVMAIATKTGKSPEEVISERKKIDSNAVFRTNYAQNASDRFKSAKNNQFVLSPENFNNTRNQAILAAQSEFPGMPRRELEQLVEGVSGGGIRLGAGNEAAEALRNPATGKIEDRTVAGQAEASRVMLDNFQKMSSQIAPTAEAMANFNKQLQATVDIVMKMPEAERNGVFSKLFPSMYPQNQTQSGRPGGK